MRTDIVEQAKRGRRAAVWMAAAASVLIALLFWFWERDLIWMVAVLLPLIWIPMIHHRFGDDRDGVRTWAVPAMFGGLVLLACLAVFVYLAV